MRDVERLYAAILGLLAGVVVKAFRNGFVNICAANYKNTHELDKLKIVEGTGTVHAK